MKRHLLPRYFNLRNNHWWEFENPHLTRECGHNFRINYCREILRMVFLIAIICMNDPMKIHNVLRLGNINIHLLVMFGLQFLQNIFFQLLEELPLQMRQEMWYMHDDAHAHFPLTVRQWLNEHVPDRWIRREHAAPYIGHRDLQI